MPYVYEELKPRVFTETGSVMFTHIRDRIRRLLRETGAIAMGAAIGDCTGDSWTMLACVDRLVELDELREVGQAARGQDRVFVPGPEWVAV